MKNYARVVVIGGGVAGCSTLYHLTKLGWSDFRYLSEKERFGYLACAVYLSRVKRRFDPLILLSRMKTCPQYFHFFSNFPCQRPILSRPPR